MLSWSLAALVGLIGLAGAFIYMKLQGWNLMSWRVLLNTASILSVNTAVAIGIAFTAAPPDSALKDTLALMFFLGPLVIAGIFLGQMATIQRAYWQRYQQGLPLPPQVRESDVVEWGRKHGHA